jgi:putative Holliday junction resolvase
MAKHLGIDYGLKRTGIAISDSLGMIAAPMKTVPTEAALDEIEKIILKEKIKTVVVGEARYSDGSESEITVIQEKFCKRLQNKIPAIQIVREDERYSSQIAFESLIEGGFKKKERRKKENTDLVAAAIILQRYLDKLSSVQ